MNLSSLPPGFTRNSSHTLPLHLLDQGQWSAWRDAQSAAHRAWIESQKFAASAGAILLLPGPEGVAGAVSVIGDVLDPSAYGHLAQGLPEADWRVDAPPTGAALAALQLGWGLGSYRFTRYKQAARAPARLLLEDQAAEALDVLAACVRVRDLVNTPTEHMGPGQLEEVARDIATRHGAQLEAITGDELLARNFPAIHAVGRASHRAPRLIVLRWGDSGLPHVALVGKGVCFDTGGLDLKAADGMR
ncbi:MAG: leucyl aminopeptidase family protein, partial [Lysobacteraceae bacterium]